MPFMFEKLEVYQKAVDFADEVAALTEGFPRGYGFLVDQLNRAALSIATNLAEGNGRFTKPDRRNFFTIARGSAQECVPLLEIARRRGLKESKDMHCGRFPSQACACCRTLFVSLAHQFTVRLPGPSAPVSRLHGLTLSILDRLAYGRVAHASWKRTVAPGLTGAACWTRGRSACSCGSLSLLMRVGAPR